jgi:adenosylmethionine-8-amino-7-oxononanoate aminotransferase
MELTYSAPGLTKHAITKTDGYWSYTEDSKLLDMLCGNTAFIFGYNDESIFHSMLATQQTVGFLRGASNETCNANDKLINQLCTVGNFTSVSWAVSGSDGVELAISANDQYWQTINKHKPTVVVFNPNYHGTTYLAKIFRGQYSTVDRCVSVSTLEELTKVLGSNDKIGAVLMESCPWIDGIKPWSKLHWEVVRYLCDQYSINFIVDDVFGGVGKLGYVFSHQRYDVQPDIVVLGKSLTAGYSPLSCACVNQRITDVVKDNWDYGHTWSPNMAGIGAALEVLKRFDSTTSDVVIDTIESKLNDLGGKILATGLVSNYTTIGLLLEFTLIFNYAPDVLIRHGLNGTISDNNTIKICAPVIADDEYFTCLTQNLQQALLDK